MRRTESGDTHRHDVPAIRHCRDHHCRDHHRCAAHDGNDAAGSNNRAADRHHDDLVTNRDVATGAHDDDQHGRSDHHDRDASPTGNRADTASRSGPHHSADHASSPTDRGPDHRCANDRGANNRSTGSNSTIDAGAGRQAIT